MNVYVTFIFLFIVSFSQFACSSGASSDLSSKNAAIKQQPLVVFLVRHTEKVDFNKDPKLSPAGIKRALELVNVLQDTNIQYVHSSNYIRTRETAAPIIKQFGLSVNIYDPSDLESLAREVTAQGGIHLIVGHSNTTPEMVKLLGGDAKSPIDDTKEFDRLYIVTVTKGGSASSILMRYGKPYKSGN